MTKLEFATWCGMEKKKLAVYIKRGKVDVIDGGQPGQIDSTTPRNIDFHAKHSERSTGEVAAPAPAKVRTKKQTEQSPAPVDEKLKLMHELEKERKSLELEKTRQQNEMLSIDLLKKRGKLLPTDEVKNLFAQHSRSISMNFKQFIENFLSEVGQKSKLNGNQLAELRGKMIVMLNKSIDDAVNETKKSLEALRDSLDNGK